MIPRSLFWLALALLPASALSAQASIFCGTPGGTGDVLVFPAPGTTFDRPAKLQGIELLPVDAAGRSAFTQFQPEQPRLKNDVPLAARILLPQNQGSLYRYRRDRVGGADFGYFVVRPSGVAVPLFDVPGSGGAGTNDPLPFPVAVSAQGDAFLTATTLAAGGDLFEVGVTSGQVRQLTPGMPPLDILPQGLALLTDWGVALTTKGPLRFMRGTGLPITVPLVPKGGAGALGHNPGHAPVAALTYFGNGLAKSADGSAVAVIAGTSSTQAFVYAFGSSGPSVRVNENAAPIVDPGSGTEAGPTLALSPDGSRAAWKTHDNSLQTSECFSRQVPRQPTVIEEHITGIQNFTDTLNETGVIAFFDPTSVVMLVGEPNGVGGIEKADFFRARFNAVTGTTALTNLSNTSGDTLVPFLSKGALDTTDGIFQIPGQSGSVYFVSGSSGRGQIIRLDESTATTDVMRDGVAGFDFIERSGANFVLGILNDQPVERELLQVPFDHTQNAVSLGLFPSTDLFSAFDGNLDGTFAGILNVSGGQRLAQIDLPTGVGDQHSDIPAPYGPVLGYDGSGAVLASVSYCGRTYFISWTSGSPATLYQTPGIQGLVLPGN